MRLIIYATAVLTATTSFIVVESGMFDDQRAISQTNTEIYRHAESLKTGA